MERINLNVGDTVVFGRNHGEKTSGRIVKLNPKKAKIETLESRGSRSEAGQVWNVPYSLIVSKGSESVSVPAQPQPPLVYSPFAGADNSILEAINILHGQLSPENLSCDGELSRSQVRSRAGSIKAKLEHLYKAIGRRVDESEAWAWYESRRKHEENRRAPVGV